MSQQNPKANSIHYLESNPRVLFINIRSSTFRGAGMWNPCWQLCHYSIQNFPSSEESLPTTSRKRTLLELGNGSSRIEHLAFERHIPTIAAPQQLSIRGETTLLTGQSELLRPWPIYVYRDALEIGNTGWLGRTKTMTGQSLLWYKNYFPDRRRLLTLLTEHLHVFVLYNSPKRQENLAYLGTISTSKMRCQFSL